MKKIELHLHLDGSVNIDYVSKKLGKKTEEVKSEMEVDETCSSLTDYLQKFKLPISIMQSKESLEEISYELVEELKKDDVIYAEIRFAPNFHTQKLSLNEVVDSVLKGLSRGKIKTNLILCCMRGDTKENNEKIIDLAYQYLNKGVCAIDLAGDEKNYPNELYSYIFEKCKKLNIPFTIHAGEASGYQSIEQAIALGTKRIGHGIRAIENEETIKKLIDKNITLEICPTSNLNTLSMDIKNHPVYELYKKGVKVTINTDNRTVSNTSLEKEYDILKKTFQFQDMDFIKMNKNAIEASFLNQEEKEKLLLELEK